MAKDGIVATVIDWSHIDNYVVIVQMVQIRFDQIAISDHSTMSQDSDSYRVRLNVILKIARIANLELVLFHCLDGLARTTLILEIALFYDPNVK